MAAPASEAKKVLQVNCLKVLDGADIRSPFCPAALVAAASGFVEAPSLSADDHLLYSHKLVNSSLVIQLLRR